MGDDVVVWLRNQILEEVPMLLAEDRRSEDEGQDVGEWACHLHFLLEGSATEVVLGQVGYHKRLEATVEVISKTLVNEIDSAMLLDCLARTGNVAKEGPGLLIGIQIPVTKAIEVIFLVGGIHTLSSIRAGERNRGDHVVGLGGCGGRSRGGRSIEGRLTGDRPRRS